MWKHGTIWATDKKVGYDYWVKVYDRGSKEYGIDGGRISKLTIRKRGESRDLVNYDRGWDIPVPDDVEVKVVYAILIDKFN